MNGILKLLARLNLYKAHGPICIKRKNQYNKLDYLQLFGLLPVYSFRHCCIL